MSSKPGKIDLSGLFEAERIRLINAVSQGSILHKTNNVRDAGARLEGEFRDFLGSRIPPRFQVRAGYLFDAQSVCTPQIDAIVIDGDQAHEIMRSEGAVYVPFPSGVAAVEIKNSGNDIRGSLAQLSKAMQAIEDMMNRGATALRATSPRGQPARAVAPSATISIGEEVVANSLPDLAGGPLSVLVVGSTGKAKPQAVYKAYTTVTHPPDYLIFLDSGRIIARRSADLPGYPLFFRQYRSRGGWGVFGATSGPRREAQALLWLYAAIADHLNAVAHDGQGGIAPFTHQISRDFPMNLLQDLSSAKAWKV